MTSELALYNAGLEPTRPQGSFDIFLGFRDGAKIPDSLRHGVSGVIDHGGGGSASHELVIEEVVSLGSVEGDSVTLTDNFDFGSKSEGRLLILWGMICESCNFVSLRVFFNSFLPSFQVWARRGMPW